ncbi:MAG: PfkB family carbohydrate kinase, partial [Anaerolineae bacterium]|nr:PfkB family carbohydrate kinase [Anaerolineae bacterium]
AAMGATVADDDVAATLQMARTIIERGAALVVITLGAEGALVVTSEAGWVARPPAVGVISAVGSGDAFLAGLAVSLMRKGQPLTEALRLGVACGTANATTAQPGVFERDLVERLVSRVEVRQIR